MGNLQRLGNLASLCGLKNFCFHANEKWLWADVSNIRIQNVADDVSDPILKHLSRQWVGTIAILPDSFYKFYFLFISLPAVSLGILSGLAASKTTCPQVPTRWPGKRKWRNGHWQASDLLWNVKWFYIFGQNLQNPLSLFPTYSPQMHCSWWKFLMLFVFSSVRQASYK